MRIGAPLNHEQTPALQWVEIASTLQLPSFHLVGLPSPEVTEAKERVRAAIEASGFTFPKRRVTLNLSPAYVRKGGTGLDLAMALAIIQSEAESDTSEKTDLPGAVVAWGELGLDGTLKPVGQIYRATYSCWDSGARLLILSRQELAVAQQAMALIRIAHPRNQGRACEIRGVSSLQEAWELVKALGLGKAIPNEESVNLESPVLSQKNTPALMPLAKSLERVISVAAAGAHHLLMLGPRGTGKSHALDWLSAIQPEPPPGTRLRNRIVAELRQNHNSHSTSQIRRVSSQVKPAALLGTVGVAHIRPGELSLADGGVLIADEFLEWHRDSRECLREPMERGVVTLTRSHGFVELPAEFALAANGNLCPCGGWPPELPLPAQTDETYSRKPPRCRCGFRERTQYLARLSGPILDRVDLVTLVMPSVRRARKAEITCVNGLLARIERAREQMVRRWGAIPGRLSAVDIETLMKNNPIWESAVLATEPSTLRARHKTVRVALTLAEWDGCEIPDFAHFSEASLYRPERIGLCH